MFFVCVLSYVVSGGGPDIALTTHSGRSANVFLSRVLIHSPLLRYKHLTHGQLGCKPQGGVIPTLGQGKQQRKKQRRNDQLS